MKTIHAMADPHIRIELTNHGQYCGPTNPPRRARTKKSGKKGRGKKQRVPGGDNPEQFDHYCDSAVNDWDTCKQLGTELINSGDDQLVADIEAYRDVSCEEKIYSPFERIVNRAFQFARESFVDVDVSGPSPPHNLSLSTAETKFKPDLSLNLLAVPTHSRPIHGCADKRK